MIRLTSDKARARRSIAVLAIRAFPCGYIGLPAAIGVAMINKCGSDS